MSALTLNTISGTMSVPDVTVPRQEKREEAELNYLWAGLLILNLNKIIFSWDNLVQVQHLYNQIFVYIITYYIYIIIISSP